MSRKLNGAIAAALVLGAVIATSDANADFFEGLGFLPGYDYSETVGVSANGKRVAGNIRPIGNEFDGASQAFLWTATRGMIGLGYPTGDDVSRAVAISGNGSKIIGTGTTLAGGAGFTSFVWSATKGFSPIPGMPSYGAFGPGIPAAINANGRVVGGGAPITTYPFGGSAVLWSAAAGQVKLVPFGGTTGVSANGSVAVGTELISSSPSHGEAFRWTPSTDAVGLGFLPGALDSAATAVSSNGSSVVGSVHRYGDIGDEAFRWTAATGIEVWGGFQAIILAKHSRSTPKALLSLG